MMAALLAMAVLLLWVADPPPPGSSGGTRPRNMVAEPRFNVRHGFYDRPFTVTLSSPTAGARIRYTIDGSVPTITTGKPYADNVTIDRTTTLRARAFREGWQPSSVVTCTWIFPADVIRQSADGQRPTDAWPPPNRDPKDQVLDYGMDPRVVDDPRYAGRMRAALRAIPSISLVTDLDNLFDPDIGIYTNAEEQGRAWERPVSVEWLDPDGGEGFQIDAGIRIRGNASRNEEYPKHSFRLFFRAQYGASRLRFPIFGEQGRCEFRGLDLPTGQDNSWSCDPEHPDRFTMLADVFSRDTQRDMGQPYTRSRYCHLYLNGQYWGIYQLQERSDEDYAVAWFGGEQTDYDIIKGDENLAPVVSGNIHSWYRLWSAAAAGFEDQRRYAAVQGLDPDGSRDGRLDVLLDPDNLIDYMLCTYCVGDRDAPFGYYEEDNTICPNNFFCIYRRGGDGYKFLRYDAESSLESLDEDRTDPWQGASNISEFNAFNPQWLHDRLMANPHYRERFKRRVGKHFFADGALTPAACKARFLARAEQIRLAIVAESARWGDAQRQVPRTRDDHWKAAVDRIVEDYFPNRTGIVLEQFRKRGWWSE